MKWVKMYKLPVIKCVRNEDTMSSIMTTVKYCIAYLKIAKRIMDKAAYHCSKQRTWQPSSHLLLQVPSTIHFSDNSGEKNRIPVLES